MSPPTKKTPRPGPQRLTGEQVEALQTTMAYETELAQGRVAYSAGMAHFNVGVIRIDVSLGLLGTDEELARDFEAAASVLRAGRAMVRR